MSEKRLKVTDRRMFTADGELREEFSHLESESAESQPAPEPTPVVAEAPPERPAAPQSAPPFAAEAAAGPAPPEEDQPAAPQDDEEAAGPGFYDLVGILAQPIGVYMRDAQAGNPQTAAQSLQLARLHIELLSVLKDKTSGNLAPEESAMLDDVLFQVRSAFVGSGG